jgi:protein gp37
MRDYMTAPDRKRTIAAAVMQVSDALAQRAHALGRKAHEGRVTLDHFSACFAGHGPFPNIWLGVSVEDQVAADERIPPLLSTPAVVRFLSCEPLLGPVDLNRIHETFEEGRGHLWESCLNGKRFDPWSDGDLDGMPKIDWVICGGESGPGARPMMVQWARGLRDQCIEEAVPFFFKQWGEHQPDDPAAERTSMVRVGKKVAGRLLDGRTWDEFPQVPA